MVSGVSSTLTKPVKSITEYNGAAIIAMKGKDCVAIAADRRFGIQALTLSTDFQKVFKMTDRTFIGLAGLATDVQTMCGIALALTALFNTGETGPRNSGSASTCTSSEKSGSLRQRHLLTWSRQHSTRGGKKERKKCARVSPSTRS